MMQLLRNNKKIIAVVTVVLLTTVTTYAMTVDSFTDYNPPDYLHISWGDYMQDDAYSTPTANNAVSNFPRWSVEYPYRAIFLGGTPSKDIQYYVVYSKVPATDLFTFEYESGNKGTYQLGRIRMYMPSGKVGLDNDFQVVLVGHNPTGISSIISNAPQVDFSVTTSNVGTQSMKKYFKFDFFYDCADEHQQNVQNLNISGITNISGVPYNYIINCDDHIGYTGGGGGGSSSGGGLSGDKNANGDGGRHGWGTGDYGGGVNKHKWDVSTGNKELSVPDDWKKPIEDNYNKMPEYSLDLSRFPEYVPADGDTGNNGSDWELPSVDIENDGVSGEIQGYKEVKPQGEQHLIDFMAPMEEWLE